LEQRSNEAEPFTRILRQLEKYHAIERARERAQTFTDKARQLISEFPDSPYQRALLAVTELVTERDH
jgi:octaprenyl-diphosphate synthase